MAEEVFSAVGQIVKPQFMADRSFRIVLDFGEVNPEVVAVVCRLMNGGNVGVVIAKESDLQELNK